MLDIFVQQFKGQIGKLFMETARFQRRFFVTQDAAKGTMQPHKRRENLYFFKKNTLTIRNDVLKYV